MAYSYRVVIGIVGLISALAAFGAMNVQKVVRWNSSDQSQMAATTAANAVSRATAIHSLSFNSITPLKITPAQISETLNRTPALKQALATLKAKSDGEYKHSAHGVLNRRMSHHSSYQQNPAAISNPVLVTETDTARAIAVETSTLKREPFFPSTALAWGPDPTDRHTRISLFAMNVGSSFGDSPANLSIDAEDSAHNHYLLSVEFVGAVPDYSWLTMIVVRLDESLDLSEDVLLRINAHGLVSKRVRIVIVTIVGGLLHE